MINISHYITSYLTVFFLLSHSYVSYVWQGADGTDAAVIAARKAWEHTKKRPGGSVASKGSPTNWIPSGYVKIAIENGHL